MVPFNFTSQVERLSNWNPNSHLPRNHRQCTALVYGTVRNVTVVSWGGASMMSTFHASKSLNPSEPEGVESAALVTVTQAKKISQEQTSSHRDARERATERESVALKTLE